MPQKDQQNYIIYIYIRIIDHEVAEQVGTVNHFTSASPSTAEERHVRVSRRVGRDNDVGAFSTVTSTRSVLARLGQMWQGHRGSLDGIY